MVMPVNDETDFYFQAILISLASALFSLFIWFVKSFVWFFFAKCLYFVFYYLALLTSVWVCLYWFFSQLELKSGGHRRFALSFVFLFFSIYINGSLYEKWFCNKTHAFGVSKKGGATNGLALYGIFLSQLGSCIHR